jgi:pimeloyl-ACP methyl ester carboxylesterase
VLVPSTWSIVCDDSASRRPGLDYLPIQNGNDSIYPRFGSANFGVAITLCSGWPRTVSTPLANLATRHPIVLIGNDYDPATPMAWSRNMAAALGPEAALVRYQGGGHTIYGSIFGGGSACINDAVESYFRDLTVPAKGLTCPAQPLSFATPQRASAATMAEVLRQVMPAPALPRLPRR